MELAREDRITDTSFNDEFIISNDVGCLILSKYQRKRDPMLLDFLLICILFSSQKEPLKPTERRSPSDQLISGGGDNKQINGKRDKRIASDQKI